MGVCSCLPIFSKPQAEANDGDADLDEQPLITKFRSKTCDERRQRNRERIRQEDADLLLEGARNASERFDMGNGRSSVVFHSFDDDMVEFLVGALLTNEMLGPLLTSFNPMQLRSIIQSSTKMEVAEGNKVHSDGDTDAQFYIVAAGTLNCLKDGERSTLNRGDSFGELAMVCLAPSVGTVSAVSKATLYAFKRGTLRAVCQEDTVQKLQTYTDMVAKVDIFQHKAAGVHQQIADALVEMRVPQGEYLFAQGATVSAYWLLYEGEVAYEVDGKETTRVVGSPGIAAQGKAPELGRRHLDDHECRGNSAKVVSQSALLLTLDRKIFLKLAQRSNDEVQTKKSGKALWNTAKNALHCAYQQKIEAYRDMLGQVEIFRALSEARRTSLASHVHQLHLSKGEYVFKLGDDPQYCYILHDGEITYLNDVGLEVARLIGNPLESSAPLFGARAIRFGSFRSASCMVLSETASVLCLDGDLFMETVNAHGGLLRGSTSSSESDLVRKTAKYLSGSHTSIKTSLSSPNTLSSAFTRYRYAEMKELGLLGTGAFGSVTMVRHIPSKQRFALKALSKGYVAERGMVVQVINERNILKLVMSPWVVCLVACFNSDDYLFFLMELVLGGELVHAYEEANLFGDDSHARFHIACILRGLGMLHSRQLVYRDLKPENVLLDKNGYCKITDFGLSKLVTGRTETVCGTPEYVAPEILLGAGYNRAVDWWALGILIFELMTGRTPFQCLDDDGGVEKTLRKVAMGMKIVTFPSKGAWNDLVHQLCTQEPSLRLTMRPKGVKNVEEHAWYGVLDHLPKFDWHLFNMRRMKAPYVPVCKTEQDMRDFAAEAEMPPFVPSDRWKEDPFADLADEWGPTCLE